MVVCVYICFIDIDIDIYRFYIGIDRYIYTIHVYININRYIISRNSSKILSAGCALHSHIVPLSVAAVC